MQFLFIEIVVSKLKSEPEIEFESQKEHFYKLGEKSIFSMENRPAFNFQDHFTLSSFG